MGFILVVLSTQGALSQPQPQSFKLMQGGVQVTTPSWGPHCPERPPNRRDRAGLVYRLQDNHFVASGRSPKIDESGVCRAATGLPAIKETRTETGYRCRSPKGIGTRATGTVSRETNEDGRVVIRHRFEYDWRLHGSHCQVRSKGKWTLTPDAPKAPMQVESEGCSRPGAAVKLRPITAATTRSTPTGTSRLKVQPLDKNGCPTKAKLRWKTSHGKIDRSGRLTLKKVKTGKTVLVTASTGRLRQVFRVLIEERDTLADLAPLHQAYNPELQMQSEDQAQTVRVTIKATVDSEDSATSTLPLTLASLLALISGVICIIIGLRLKRRTTQEQTDDLV